jgi:hypothetical protein
MRPDSRKLTRREVSVMVPLLFRDRPYHEWLDHLFDHQVSPMGTQWYWDRNAPYWGSDAEPIVAVDLLTKMFEEPSALLERFTTDQIGQGLWYIISSGTGDHFRVLHDDAVPLESRRRCVNSIYDFYRQLVAPTCSDLITHHFTPGPQPRDPLYLSCYMFWDIAMLTAEPPFEDEVIQVLESTLALPSLTCQEAAIHGLGENHYYATEAVERVLTEYLKRADLDAELERYAVAAKTGCV